MSSAHHKKIISHFKSRKPKETFFDNERYLLSTHYYYGFTVPERRVLAKSWLKENRDISKKDFLSFVDELYDGHSYDEKTLASMLLEYSPYMRKEVRFADLDRWLNGLVGWAEIDSFCSGIYTGEEMIERWKEWERFILKLSKDKNINKRRAALVYLVKPLNFSKEKRVLDFSLGIVEALKHEKPIVITKAVSWVLRMGVKNFKKEIANYVEANKISLPKIAIRETLRKIATGKK